MAKSDAELGLEFLLRLGAHSINEKDAAQVVRFVLHRAREQTPAAELNALAFFIHADDMHRF